ncbi:MAG: hypothetical protein WCG05_04515 [Alphaproteobacteria bacterium]
MQDKKTDSYAKKNAERLSKALRENLLKRKQQKRAKEETVKKDT